MRSLSFPPFQPITAFLNAFSPSSRALSMTSSRLYFPDIGQSSPLLSERRRIKGNARGCRRQDRNFPLRLLNPFSGVAPALGLELPVVFGALLLLCFPVALRLLPSVDMVVTFLLRLRLCLGRESVAFCWRQALRFKVEILYVRSTRARVLRSRVNFFYGRHSLSVVRISNCTLIFLLHCSSSHTTGRAQ